jgi:Tannase and feruloyl esterase
VSWESHWWRVYLLPAAILQSVMIRGGYDTGREVIENFTSLGIVGGPMGLGLFAVALAPLLPLSYEFARVYQAYDYRHFFRAFLGRGWIAFEVLCLAMFALVFAVVAAPAGTLFEDQFQGVNERLDGWTHESHGAILSRPKRAVVAILCVGLGGGSLFGVVDPIARHYSALAWRFFAPYIVPLSTWRVYRLRAEKSAVAVVGIFVMSLHADVGRAQTASSEGSAESCAALKTARFLGVLDAPTQIASARLVPASERLPAYCEVTGLVSQRVGILVALPAMRWNSKLLEQGCGGFCGGNLPKIVKNFGASFLSDPLRRGYAFAMYDGGHSGEGTSARWAYNNLQAQFDFGIRAPHVAALAAKAIVNSYYGSAPTKSYFRGCSSGGAQALSEAQRFPWDFDGILAGAPSPTFSGPMMNYLWAARALAGTINYTDLQLVHAHAVAKCDLDDGVEDGVIGDPLHCVFDPAELQCEAEHKDGCLTPAQVAAVKKVYSGPMNAQGEKLTTGGPLPGSELNWIADHVSGAYIAGDAPEPWPKEYFAYVGFMPAPGPIWMPANFDFDRDYKRLRTAESLFGAADNPDLRRFKAAGGKLILYQGGQDQSDVPTDSIDYYQTTQKTMGGHRAMLEFFRLFLLPGMNHCVGGPGASAVDYLSYLEAWVEKSQAPDVIIGSHEDNNRETPKTVFTRPIYPYPLLAKYKGSGDPSDAASFVPVGGQE